jgi:hypothetical protein
MKIRDAPDSKIGSGHLAGMARQGLRELRGALYADSNVAQQPDYGLYGMSTPGEVAQARQAETPTLEEERGSTLDSRVQHAEAYRDDRGRDDKGLDRE